MNVLFFHLPMQQRKFRNTKVSKTTGHTNFTQFNIKYKSAHINMSHRKFVTEVCLFLYNTTASHEKVLKRDIPIAPLNPILKYFYLKCSEDFLKRFPGKC